MNKSKIKEIMICLISLAILTVVILNGTGSKVLAANTSSELDNLINSRQNSIANDVGDDDDDDDDEENVVNTNKNTNKNNNVKNNTANNTSNNANKNTNSGIPYTGLDNSVTFVIIAFGISAVFAYKKIRDYKNI